MDHEPTQTVSAMILDALRGRNLSIEKLSLSTGISERYLTSLVNETFELLPAVPYTRGYVLKVAETLSLDGSSLWQAYVREHTDIRRSGKRDTLPENRFTTSRWLSKRLIIAIVVAALIITYLIVRLPAITGTPALSVTSPVGRVVVTAPSFILAGTADPADEVSVNRELLRLGPDGSFTKQVRLEPGFNTFVFQAKRFLGREVTRTEQVFYQPESSPAAVLQEPHTNGTETKTGS
ncbi:MAG: helix-turn-helix domain-containing protein [bacterium]|nr:helix-turn-helix domain-containing protein [bacterium]